MITVDEVMSVAPLTLTPANSLADAQAMMEAQHIRHIPIVDDAGAVVGLVTHRDVLAASASNLKAESNQQSPANVLISEFMTRDVASVNKSAGLRQAALYLEQHRYGCLLVIDNDQLEGIVTDSDFVAVAINLLEQIESTEPSAVEL